MSFTCPDCGMTSHNPNDEREGFCGRCNAFTRDPRKAIMSKHNIAVVDVETTGLDPNKDKLLEIAVIVVNQELEELGEYHAIVGYDHRWAGRLRAQTTPYVRAMHEKTGLWDKLSGPEASSLSSIDLNLAEWLRVFGKIGEMPVMGNSVRLDMNFMDRYLPSVASYLSYQMRDVSTVAGFANDWYDLPYFEKHNDHTALKDVRETIREMKHYRDLVFVKEEDGVETQYATYAIGVFGGPGQNATFFDTADEAWESAHNYAVQYGVSVGPGMRKRFVVNGEEFFTSWKSLAKSHDEIENWSKS